MKYQQPAQTFENLDRPRLSFSGFDLSHRHTTTFDLGEVIPIAVLETIPNDRWDLSTTGVLRMQPLVAPLLPSYQIEGSSLVRTIPVTHVCRTGANHRM